MIKRSAIITGIFILCSGILFATANSASLNIDVENRATITGSVLDAQSGEPIVGAEVVLVELNQTTTTDENGDFSLEAEPGEYTLEVEADGYEKSEERVEVTEDGTNVWIELEPEY